ncbi:MAG: Flp family type IVb pilin [Actinobacteria bacterium]|nr:MAG: Flp family type IVb pilin [Actinomycetota bacterium]
MRQMLTRLYCWATATMKSEDGATAVEYGIMVALIAIGIILAVTALGGQLSGLFTRVSDTLAGA